MRGIIIFLVSGTLLAQPLPVSTPLKEGFSPERVERMHKGIQQYIDEGTRAGAITMLVRNGNIVDWHAYGYRDLERKLPMEKDTICRIWSMTKVVTSVAAMMLVEEGKIRLDDPISKYIPELKELKVYQSGTADAPNLVPASRPITVKHLLTHTSGLTYGSDPSNAVAQIYNRTKIFEVSSLKEFIGKVASVPLQAHPGEKYIYGINLDVLGYLIERVSDLPFDRFVQARILDPLKMTDTTFFLPKEKVARLAASYSIKEGKLQAAPETVRMGNVPFGGMGLYSTIGDYARFAQMLLNGGELNGVRLLGRKTVELMMTNHLGDLAKPHIDQAGGEGFGLGGSVKIDLAKGSALGSVGSFGWSGAATTWFRIDPKEKAVALLFMQYLPYDRPTIDRFSTLFYQSLN